MTKGRDTILINGNLTLVHRGESDYDPTTGNLAMQKEYQTPGMYPLGEGGITETLKKNERTDFNTAQ